jgi:hypothetical protein
MKRTTSKIDAKLREQQRLLKLLEYYEWLADHGVTPEDVKRVSETQAPRTIHFTLSDGRKVSLPWPPFDDNVVLNRRET